MPAGALLRWRRRPASFCCCCRSIAAGTECKKNTNRRGQRQLGTPRRGGELRKRGHRRLLSACVLPRTARQWGGHPGCCKLCIRPLLPKALDGLGDARSRCVQLGKACHAADTQRLLKRSEVRNRALHSGRRERSALRTSNCDHGKAQQTSPGRSARSQRHVVRHNLRREN